MTATLHALLKDLKEVAYYSFFIEQDNHFGFINGSPLGITANYEVLYKLRNRVEAKEEFRNPEGLSQIAALVGKLHYEIFLELGKTPGNENLQVELIYPRGGGISFTPVKMADPANEEPEIIGLEAPALYLTQIGDGDIFCNSVRLKDLQQIIELPKAFDEYGHTPIAYCGQRRSTGVYECYPEDGKILFASFTTSEQLLAGFKELCGRLKAEEANILSLMAWIAAFVEWEARI